MAERVGHKLADSPSAWSAALAGETPARWVVFLVAAPLFVLYVLTGSYGEPYGVDAFTNAAQSRAFAEDQHPILEELDGLGSPDYQGTLAWFTEAPEGTTSQYPPGAAIWAAPFYLFDYSTTEVTLGSEDGEQLTISAPNTYVPATVAAALSVAIAIGFLGFTLSRLLPQRGTVGAMLIAGLGTSAWSVAADKLWQHGPAMMCISAGTYLASRDRFGASGLVFAAAILVRPHTALVAAGIGLGVAGSRRSIREVATMGATSSIGLALLLVYNNAVHGSYSISGGYGSDFSDRFANDSPFVVFERLAASLVHGRVGMLWMSPFLAITLFALVRKRSVAPDWAIGSAIGGLAYLFVQYRANRVTGGAGFFSYRYPLEALMAAGPMMAVATWAWLTDGERRKRVFRVLVILSITAHSIGGVFNL